MEGGTAGVDAGENLRWTLGGFSSMLPLPRGKDAFRQIDRRITMCLDNLKTLGSKVHGATSSRHSGLGAVIMLAKSINKTHTCPKEGSAVKRRCQRSALTRD
eukprot:3048113-Amphidinium_carterae.1